MNTNLQILLKIRHYIASKQMDAFLFSFAIAILRKALKQNIQQKIFFYLKIE